MMLIDLSNWGNANQNNFEVTYPGLLCGNGFGGIHGSMGNSPVATELTIMTSFPQAAVTCHSLYSSVYTGLIKLLKVQCTVANIHVLASHCFSLVIPSL